MKITVRAFISSAVEFVLLCTSLAAADFSGRVVGIIDGATLEVLHNRHPERIRLSGIDCPEKSQAYGQKAKQAASDLAFGKEVTRQTHGLDKYGRTLADVHLLRLNRGRNIPWDLCELDC